MARGDTFVGRWTYRSFHNDPDPTREFNDLRLEGVGTIDACATISEAAIVVALGALALVGMARERTTLIGLVFATILLVIAHLPHLLLLLVALL